MRQVLNRLDTAKLTPNCTLTLTVMSAATADKLLTPADGHK